MQTAMSISRWCQLVLALVISAPSIAKVSGTFYAAQGVAYNDGGNFIAQDGQLEANYFEFAANAHWRLTPRWRFAGQVTRRQLGDFISEDTAVDYLFGRYQYPLKQGHLSATLGRFKNDFGWYNASRDSLFSRPSILLPSSIYREWGRDAALRRDGLLLNGLHYWGQQSLSWSLSYGEVDFSDQFTQNLFGSSRLYQTQSRGATSATVSWQYRPWWQLKYSYSQTRFEVQGTPAALLNGGFSEAYFNVDTHLLSLRSEWQRWQLIAEWQRQPIQQTFPQLGAQISPVSDGGYIQLRYLVHDQWQLYGRRDLFWANDNDRNGQQVVAPLPNYSAYARTWMLGSSWQITSDWQLSLEWHRLEGAGTLPQWQVVQLGQAPTSHLYLLQLAYRWSWAR
ncbi:MAG: hypothetical protein R3Y10_02720 [Ferrimonas sp.]